MKSKNEGKKIIETVKKTDENERPTKIQNGLHSINIYSISYSFKDIIIHRLTKAKLKYFSVFLLKYFAFINNKVYIECN